MKRLTVGDTVPILKLFPTATPETMKKITAKTPKGAANQAAKILRKIAVECGQREDEVIILSDGVTVCWEGGPFEWTMALTGGVSLFGFGAPEIDTYGDHVYAECKNGYALTFYRN